MTRTELNRLAYVWLAVVVAITMLLLSSCYSAKKAESQTNKALIKHPEVVAKIARTAFPCIQKSADSTGYFIALAQRDSVAAAADSLGNWITYLRGKLSGLVLDSLTAANCGELLQQVESYAKEVEQKNAELSRQIKNIKPATILVPIEDSAKIWAAQVLQRRAEDSSNKYRILYQQEKTDHDALKAKAKGKVVIYIPIWLLILLALGGAYAVISKVRDSFNPFKWFT